VSTAEYDAFGPWVDEVRTPDDVPRLYRDHPLDLGACRLVLKVPRNINRRDASPEMDLYDQLLIAGREQLTVLRRQGAGYVQQAVAYDEVVAVVDSVNLLDGRLVVHTASGAAVTVRYNGSSQRALGALVRVLREQSAADDALSAGPAVPSPSSAAAPSNVTGASTVTSPSSATGAPSSTLLDVGDRDVALVSAYLELARAEPGLRPLAAHGRTVVAPRGGSLTRALHVVRPMTLQGAIVCSDGLELQVLSRSEWWVRGKRPVHSLARTVLRLARLDAVEVRDDPRYAGVRVVALHAHAACIEVPVPVGSDAERVLLALPVAAAVSLG